MAASVSGPQRMDPDARRKQILACATKLFSERTYSEVSTTDIANAAGVARPLVNHYFGGKRQLYLEIVRRVVQVPPLALNDFPKATLQETAEGIIDRWISVATSNPQMWLVATSFTEAGDVEAKRISDEGAASTMEAMIPALGFDLEDPVAPAVLAALLSFAAYARETSRHWLLAGTLTEDDVRRLMVSALVALTETFRR